MNTFTLNGKTIDTHQLLNEELETSYQSNFEIDTLIFIKTWLTGQNEFLIQTSGSTRDPKIISFSRKQIITSAKRTLDTFNIKKGDKMLACLNPKFIAGTMMLVRAIEGELELTAVTPSVNPLAKLNHDDTFDFAAFSPNQIEHILQESPDKLNQIKMILIGGAGVHPILEEKLQEVKSMVFHSYAMTETLTHSAIRRVNGSEKSSVFHAIKGVTFTLDKRSCLVIHDQVLGIKKLITTDIVELFDEFTFQWKGRYDHVINSGGIKIQIEFIEQEIKKIFQSKDLNYRFCVVSEPDLALTNKIVLLIELRDLHFNKPFILKILQEKLPKYHSPKKIIQVPEIILTKTGKIDRIRNSDVYLRHGN